jgi:phosphohistidine phosphatase
MVIGHNPGLQRLALSLAGGGKAALIHRLAAKFPTGALAELAIAIEQWRAIEPGLGQLLSLTAPRDLE